MGEIRVLHCIQSLSWGGLEIYTVELIQKLAETGVKQWVLCSAHSRVAEELKKNSSNIHILPFPEKKLSKLRQALLIRKLISEHKITHLHSHTRLDMWGCALARTEKKAPKHIYNLYMNATPKQDFVHRWLFSKVDALCSSSETILEDVKKNFPIDPKKLKLIRYGRKTELFKPYPNERQGLRELYNVKPGQIVIGTLCRIDPGKGVRELVQAIEMLSDIELSQIQLWVIGDPTIIGKNENGESLFAPESAELLSWIQAQQKNPRYKDHLVQIPFQKEYIPYIEALDVFALASYNETYSLSVLDAMMMGKPVIGTKAGGTREQVGINERGVLAEPQSASSLAESFKHYLQHPKDIIQHGTNAKEWSLRNHGWKETLEKFLDLYRSV